MPFTAWMPDPKLDTEHLRRRGQARRKYEDQERQSEIRPGRRRRLPKLFTIDYLSRVLRPYFDTDARQTDKSIIIAVITIIKRELVSRMIPDPRC